MTNLIDKLYGMFGGNVIYKSSIVGIIDKLLESIGSEGTIGLCVFLGIALSVYASYANKQIKDRKIKLNIDKELEKMEIEHNLAKLSSRNTKNIDIKHVIDRM